MAIFITWVGHKARRQAHDSSGPHEQRVPGDFFSTSASLPSLRPSDLDLDLTFQVENAGTFQFDPIPF
jgi:hypothetical protein